MRDKIEKILEDNILISNHVPLKLPKLNKIDIGKESPKVKLPKLKLPKLKKV